MSVKLDDYARDEVTTRNGKRVIVDTRYVPYPMGRGYETLVFRNSLKGKVLDEGHYGESKEAADRGHTKFINKWMKQTLV